MASGSDKKWPYYSVQAIMYKPGVTSWFFSVALKSSFQKWILTLITI